MAPTTQNPASAPRLLTTTSGDYSQSNSQAVRKYLGLYGLTPPNVESYEVQAQRCTSAAPSSPAPSGALHADPPHRPQTSGNEAHAH
jgi:malate dehydrogenase (oxaloacetate-decarboxylating)(NADP+)